MNTQILLMAVLSVISAESLAGNVVDTTKVRPTEGGYVVNQGQTSQPPQLQQLTPVNPPAMVQQVAPAVQMPVQLPVMSQKSSGFSFSSDTPAVPMQSGGKSLYDTVVKPIAAQYGLPAELIGGLIQARNPNWIANFDEGAGKSGYGYGLGMITLNASKGKTTAELYDPNVNVEIMARILIRGVQLYGKDINKLIRFYLYGRAQTAGTDKEKAVIREMKKLGFNG